MRSEKNNNLALSWNKPFICIYSRSFNSFSEKPVLLVDVRIVRKRENFEQVG